MVVKTTLTLSPALMARLRERSEQEGRPLNETAVRALERGLGGAAADEGFIAVDAVVEVPPVRRYDLEEMARLRRDLGAAARGLQEDLDWARGA